MKNNLPQFWAGLKALVGYDTQDKRDKCRRIMRSVMAGHAFPIFMGHWTGVHRLSPDARQKILDSEPF